MAYQTSTGTITQMIGSLATFALANGFSAPVHPGAKSYWRITMAAKQLLGAANNVRLLGLDFKDNLGVSVGAPDTTLFSSESIVGAAAGVWAGGTWTSNESFVYTRWIGGFWSTPVSVYQLTTDYDLPSTNTWPIDFCLEWSDDGVSWHTFTVLPTNGSWDSGPYTYAYDALTWPIVSEDGLLYNLTRVPEQEDEEGTNGDLNDATGGGSNAVWPAKLFLNMGKTRIHSTYLKTQCLYNLIPRDEQVAEWHFFADTTAGKYVHCAFRMSWITQPVWYHISIGTLNKRGLTHHGVGYAAMPTTQPFPNSAITGNGQHRDTYSGNPWVASTDGDGAGEQANNSSFWYMLDSGGAGYAIPNDGAWPARGIRHSSGTFRIAHNGVWDNADAGSGVVSNSSPNPAPNGEGWIAEVHPLSGYVTLGAIPIFTRAGGSTYDDLICFMGEIPDLRICRIDNLSDGGEISQDTNTWKTFPYRKKTDLADWDFYVNTSSGPLGWAYRKVV